MSRPVRVRFAPSPTGYLHIGGVRSALFNWLWARHTGGTFILRIEDTDQSRFVPDAVEQIIDSLDQIGLTPDEGPKVGGSFGPYVQAERLEIYREYADKLVATGALYPCWCSSERLDGLRQEAQKQGVPFKYDRHCLANPQSTAEPHVLRFHIPDAPDAISWDDAVRGHIEFRLQDLDDFVALKSDGYPTYHLANVIDDHLMQISHVLRADEWLPSTPKHLLLFTAFGWELPVYAHLPAVQGPGGTKKLSKRDGAKSVSEYLEDGYLPEALISFLASLGWNDGTTQEVYSREELVESFTLDRVQKSPAMFDLERLTWVNGMMIRRMTPEELLKASKGFLPATSREFPRKYLEAALALVQDRLKVLSELPELTEFFFADPEPGEVIDTMPIDKVGKTQAHTWLVAAIEAVENISGDKQFDEASLEPVFREDLAKQLSLEKVGPLFMILRVAITGRIATPGLFETMAVLGRETCLRRLQNAADQLNR